MTIGQKTLVLEDNYKISTDQSGANLYWPLFVNKTVQIQKYTSNLVNPLPNQMENLDHIPLIDNVSGLSCVQLYLDQDEYQSAELTHKSCLRERN